MVPAYVYEWKVTGERPRDRLGTIMRILIIDDEQSLAALLGHTVKRLGHQPIVALHPHDALRLMSEDVDAVITDIDMPGMNGVDLARTLRNQHKHVPIAFCTGSDPDADTVIEASEIGRVLPKAWTVGDIKALLEELEAQLRPAPRRRRTSSDLPLSAEIESEPAPVRAKENRIRIAFRRWSQVVRLCDDSEGGPVHVTVPGTLELNPGDRIAVALALPEEMTVKIAGEVTTIRDNAAKGEPEILVHLCGMQRDIATRLRALALASEPSLQARSAPYLQVARGTDRLRTAKGTPSPEDEDEPAEPDLARDGARQPAPRRRARSPRAHHDVAGHRPVTVQPLYHDHDRSGLSSSRRKTTEPGLD
jgi:DNA-binding response OmpR family regulator